MRPDSYYEITDLDMVGKIENSLPYIYDAEQGWIFDKNFVLMDRLMGYDASEPDGSPYKIGSGDMLFRVQKISREEAEKRISAKYEKRP